MNWNGQRQTLDYLLSRMLSPERSEQLETDNINKRLGRVSSALSTQPVFHPLRFEMTAAASTSPYRQMTKSLPYDVIIVGMKTDVPARDVILRDERGEHPFVYVGNELDLRLRSDEIAGLNATVGGGQSGAFYWPSPIVVRANGRLTIEMFKPDVTADPEVGNIVLIGVRASNIAEMERALTDKDKAKIEQIIRMRPAPRTVYIKTEVNFPTAGVGGRVNNLFTPEVAEPLLIRGFRTTLRQSLVDIRLEGGAAWTVDQTPIWGVAGEDELITENYQWLSRPVLLKSGQSVHFQSITNSIDGVLFDAQEGNTITLICETV